MKLAPLVLRYQADFERKYASRLTPEIRHAMAVVLACRTERYGKMRLSCPSCLASAEQCHSCGHRSCPSCQQYDTGQWLARQENKLLPADYYMVTFTLPQEFRSFAWRYQREVYALLFRCAMDTLRTFSRNDKHLGGELGMTGVLHSHSRSLTFHPHVHVIVPGGCLLKARRQWKKHRGQYLFKPENLARVFRGKFLAALREAGFYLPKRYPRQWVAHCKHVGKGLPALQYLSRYLYRGVISENNILADDGTHVCFQYKDSKSDSMKRCRLPGEDFLWRVFQHVLPKGFRRVRDYGFLHGNAAKTRRLIQLLLRVRLPIPKPKPRPRFMCRQCNCSMNIVAFIRPSLSG